MVPTWFHILTGTLENLYEQRKTCNVEVDLSVSFLEVACYVVSPKANAGTVKFMIKPQSSIEDILCKEK